jgi:Raf kinase inhibitor-like YbhB/YbcL family protein
MLASRHLKTLAVTGAAVLVSVGAANAQAMAPKKPAAVFTFTSSTFKDGAFMPQKVSNTGKEKNPNCVGDNVSPQFSWKNAPEGTKSYALLMSDPEGRAPGGVSHWVAYGIPASVTGFAEGETSKDGKNYVGGKSTMGVGHYSGPCTPPGPPHHYTFILMATDLEPNALKPGMTREEAIKELTGHVKAAAGMIGKFRHPK